MDNNLELLTTQDISEPLQLRISLLLSFPEDLNIDEQCEF